MNLKIVTVDVCEDLRRGREPFGKVMGAVDQLQTGEALRLVAPLEPVPLFAMMKTRGFTHKAKALGGGDWEVLFERIPDRAVAPAPAAPLPCPARPKKVIVVVDLDARGLEPPQPMVKVLEALATLPDGAELRAHTDRRPMHLYAMLEERGFHGESEKQEDGSYVTHIRRS